MPIAKINLSGIGAKPSAGKSKSYPSLPSDTDTQSLVSEYLEAASEMDALKGDMELKRSELVKKAQGFFFDHYHGKTDVESSVEAKSASGDGLLITFSSRYKSVQDETCITNIIGPDRAEKFFYQAFEIKIDGDKIPLDKTTELLGKLVALFDSYKAADALTQKAVIKPSPEFHTARHTALSVAENRQLDEVCPISVAVKTKGRK